jgi:phosphoribosyl 1,2-cyclic phosphate phosphodiesterase
MELMILGSGGATTIPRPGCQCRVCSEARLKGIPYARSSSSLYIPEVRVLFDTPEEIGSQLNREGINDIDGIFYTHWHPDHTLGLRIVERMYKFWLGRFVRGDKPTKKVRVCALAKVVADLKKAYGKFLSFYEEQELIQIVKLKEATRFTVRNYQITPLMVCGGGATAKVSSRKRNSMVSTVFLIERENKKVIYAPCDVKPFPEIPQLKNADLLILGEALPDGPLKEGITIPEDNLLRKELFSMQEITGLVNRLRPRKTVLTHIEEEWGRNYDDYKSIENNYRGKVVFAYDGMKLTI